MLHNGTAFFVLFGFFELREMAGYSGCLCIDYYCGV